MEEINFVLAARIGSLQDVCDGLEAGIDVDATDQVGMTALMWASAKGHSKIVEKLLEKGATVDHQSSFGETALMWASNEGHEQVVDTLLNAGATLDITREDGQTALMRSCVSQHPKITKKLLAAGSEPDHQDTFGETGLMWACNTGNEPLVRTLLKGGATVNLKRMDGDTAISIARTMGHPRIVDLLRGKPLNKTKELLMRFKAAETAETSETIKSDDARSTTRSKSPFIDETEITPDTKPSMAQLMRMKTSKGTKVEIIKAIGPDWKEFGFLMDLDPKGKTVASIEAESAHKRNGQFVCCQEIFMRWLEKPEATWGYLIELLNDAEQKDLAEQVKDALDI